MTEESSELDIAMTEMSTEPTTAARGKRLRSLTEDAIQAQRSWAHSLEEQALAIGYRTLSKDWMKANCVMPVSIKNGPVHEVVGLRGVVRDGSWTQEPLENMTWDEIRAAADRDERQAISLHVNAAALRKLLALQAEFPNTVGPAEACSKNKTSVAQFLAAA